MKRNTPSDSHATLSYPPMAVKRSSMISDMNIPFSLENIQWREHVCEPWVLLENRDDLLTHILDLARYTIKGFEKTGRKEFKMYIHIEKKIILPQQEYETMAQGREDQERAEMIKATAMKELIGYQIATGRLLSRTELLPRLRTILREENAALEWSSLESLADQVSQTFMRTQKRGRSSLESSVEKAIEYLRVKGSDVESMGRCSICIQEVELKSYGPGFYQRILFCLEAYSKSRLLQQMKAFVSGAIEPKRAKPGRTWLHQIRLAGRLRPAIANLGSDPTITTSL
ncbi:hypothetical protein GH714_005794 [Hevea brasiliensis]|uniref:Uncharacterized protein n=1 Tax=Hevea brasiliensis TaxID=3981 RepID=A0A6A6K9R8_HEVBR|nr:hypothetical protein GH714_005794 [Hevea brasiliensis]